MNGSNNPGSWTNTLSKAAWTLLLAAILASVAWQLLKQLLVPLVVLVSLVGVIRTALGHFQRRRWR